MTLNAHQRALMDRARGLAEHAQHTPLIRGDVIGIPYEDVLDTLLLLLTVCPPEYMHVPELPDLIPCGHCEQAIPVRKTGTKYCSRECKQRAYNDRLADARARAA